MTNKRPFKRKFFSLIEVLVALGILSIILSFGMSLLSRQMKFQVLSQKNAKIFFKKTHLFQELQDALFHLVPFEKQALVTKDKKIDLVFDRGVFKDPEFSGILKGQIFEKNQQILLSVESKDGQKRQKVLADKVQKFDIRFYSQQLGWQEDWFSDDMGFPEMVHIEVKTDQFIINQKFLLPHNLHPVDLSCKSSHLSFL